MRYLQLSNASRLLREDVFGLFQRQASGETETGEGGKWNKESEIKTTPEGNTHT